MLLKFETVGLLQLEGAQMSVIRSRDGQFRQACRAMFLSLFTYFMVISCLFASAAFLLDDRAQISPVDLRAPFFYAAPAALIVLFLAVAAEKRTESKPYKEKA